MADDHPLRVPTPEELLRQAVGPVTRQPPAPIRVDAEQLRLALEPVTRAFEELSARVSECGAVLSAGFERLSLALEEANRNAARRPRR
jgi:hypothetical protein